MKNRWTQVGLVIAAMGAAWPTVALAAEKTSSNPWSTSKQGTGIYAPHTATPGMPGTKYEAPKYAPEDGRIEKKPNSTLPFVQGMTPTYPLTPYAGGYGAYPGGVGVAPGVGTGAPVYGGYGYPGYSYQGLGYPSTGHPGSIYNGLGAPGLLGGGYPGNWGGYNSPLSWMPFW